MRTGILVLRIIDGTVSAFQFSGKARRIKLLSSREASMENGELDADFVGYVERQSATFPAYLILPPGEAVLKNIVLPVREEEKILKVLGMEAEKFLPYPAEEALVNFSVVGDSKNGVEVLAAYIRRQRLEHYLDLFKKTRVKLQAVLPDLSCISHVADTDAPFFLVERMERLLRISVIAQKNPAFIRSVNTGPGGGGAFSINDVLKGEIGILQGVFALKHPGIEIERILAAGDEKFFGELSCAFPEEYGLRIDALRVLDLVEDCRQEGDKDSPVRGLDYAVGLARAVLSGEKLPDLKGRKISSGKKESPVLTAALAFLLIMLVFSGVFMGLREKSRELAGIEEEINEIVSTSFSAPELAGRSGMEIIAILRERSGFRGTMLSALEEVGVGRVLEVLRELSLKVPEERGIVITAIRIDREMCYLDGRADSFKHAEEVLNNLLASEYFPDANLARAQIDSERAGVIFRIEVVLPGEFYRGAGS